LAGPAERRSSGTAAAEKAAATAAADPASMLLRDIFTGASSGETAVRVLR
jgi:membrane protein involved in colicin uptake